jgi:transcriptional regulator with XRE-family HTH domain
LRVEQYVGQRVRDRRDELGMTQEEFGRQLGHWLGKPWSRSTVSVAENGRRAFTAAEIVAIALVLDTSPSRLFMPPAEPGEIRMPSGANLPARPLPLIRLPEDLNFAAIEETLRLLKESAARSQEAADRSQEEAARRQEEAARTGKLVHELDVLFVERLAAGGVVSMPYAEGYGPEDSEPAVHHQPVAAAESHDDHVT